MRGRAKRFATNGAQDAVALNTHEPAFHHQGAASSSHHRPSSILTGGHAQQCQVQACHRNDTHQCPHCHLQHCSEHAPDDLRYDGHACPTCVARCRQELKFTPTENYCFACLNQQQPLYQATHWLCGDCRIAHCEECLYFNDEYLRFECYHCLYGQQVQAEPLPEDTLTPEDDPPDA